MENEKVQLDEKTARLIEEMDKSLRNMEQSLGMDHPVVAKLLDSYAEVLRKNNIRALDALNMEARAKKIRAKNNQMEAQKQSEGLAESKPEKRMSASQMRMVSQLVAGILLLGFAAGALQTYKWFNQATAKNAIIKAKQQKEKEPFQFYEVGSTPLSAEQSNSESTAVAGGNPEEQNLLSTGTEAAAQAAQAEAQQSPQSLNMLELAERVLKLKKLAKENLEVGKAAEEEKDYQKAADAYSAVIQQTQQMANMSRPVFTEEIAQCYEGYGRIAELDAHPEVNQQCVANAAQVRAHMEQ